MKLNNLIDDLAHMGLQGDEAILVHSSCKAIAYDANDIIDSLMSYFQKGTLLIPTHTWKIVNEENPLFDIKMESNLGIIPNLFLKKEGVIRSYHPTHSIAGIGKDSYQILKDEEYNTTPCQPGGAYDKLREFNGYVLLLGVGNERNTFIHSVEEVLNIPNRLSAKPMHLLINKDGKILDSYMRKHYNPNQPHISEDFVKLDEALSYFSIMKEYKFGSAKALLINTRECFKLIRYVLRKDPEVIVDGTITKEDWIEYEKN